MPENNSITAAKLPGVFVISRPKSLDERGFFKEVARLDELNKTIGFDFVPKQINHSLSNPSVIRALHAENWNKLVYPLTGKIFIALVDIRRESPEFSHYITYTLDTSVDLFALLIPKGVANSICVVGDTPVNYLYLADAYYDGTDTTAVAWDDPDLNIPWPIANPLISDRDRHNPTLRQLFPDWHP